MPLTLEDVYKGLSSRMDTMTDELVRIAQKVDKIDALEEVTVKNGNGREYTQTRQQFLQWAYDFGKPGGDVDKKIDSMQAIMMQKFDAMRPENTEKERERKYDKIWKWGTRTALAIVLLAFLIKFFDWETVISLVK